jgi:hypothetical protein
MQAEVEPSYQHRFRGGALRCRRFAGETAATVAALASDICDLGCWLSYGASNIACASSGVNSSDSSEGSEGRGALRFAVVRAR